MQRNVAKDESRLALLILRAKNAHTVNFLESSFDIFSRAEDVVIPAYETFMPIYAGNRREMLTRNYDIAEKIDVILWRDDGIVIADKKLIMLVDIFEIAQRGTVSTLEFVHDVRMPEVMIGRDEDSTSHSVVYQFGLDSWT